jgi:hypothetical protein
MSDMPLTSGDQRPPQARHDRRGAATAVGSPEVPDAITARGLILSLRQQPGQRASAAAGA